MARMIKDRRKGEVEMQLYDWEIAKARKEGSDRLKNWIWIASTGQPLPGCISVEACRYVLRERGESGVGYHNT